MSAMSEPPRELASLSVEELRAVLGRQRAVNTELRAVIAAQAELHQAGLAAGEALIAGLRSQVVVLAERVAQLERQAGRDSSNSNRPPSSDSPYAKKPRTVTGRSLGGRSGRRPGK
jgi:transposase